jgi:hypothetical protein
LVYLVAALALATVVQAAGQPAPAQGLDPTALHLRAGQFSLDSTASIHVKATQPLAADGHYVIQLDGPLTPARVAQLAAAGIQLGQYLPANAYIVELPAGFDAKAKFRGLSFVRWVGPFEKSWKVDPTIGQRQFTTPERQALMLQGTVKLSVALFDGEDLQTATNAIAALPGAVILDAWRTGAGGTLLLTLPKEIVPQLADNPAVHGSKKSAKERFATIRTSGSCRATWTPRRRSGITASTVKTKSPGILMAAQAAG